MWQVVEKESIGTDWRAVRYPDSLRQFASMRFNSEKDGQEAAKLYLSDVNCNNSLTKEEKLSGIEAFMMTDEGCFLGDLDGKPWFMLYPKDIKGRNSDGDDTIKFAKGEIVKDKKFFLLEGKTEVMVRQIPGT